MKKIVFLLMPVIMGAIVANGQTKIRDGSVSPATPLHPGAILDLESNTRGLLHARVALGSTDTWGLSGTPIAGMQVYNTTLALQVFPPRLPYLP